MMEIMIKEILEKHNIKDENLANALAEIFEMLYQESKDRDATNLIMNSFKNQ